MGYSGYFIISMLLVSCFVSPTLAAAHEFGHQHDDEGTMKHPDIYDWHNNPCCTYKRRICECGPPETSHKP